MSEILTTTTSIYLTVPSNITTGLKFDDWAYSTSSGLSCNAISTNDSAKGCYKINLTELPKSVSLEIEKLLKNKVQISCECTYTSSSGRSNPFKGVVKSGSTEEF